MQYLVEVLLISIVALAISYGTSSAVCNRIGQTLFSQVTTETYETVELSDDNSEEEMQQDNRENLGLSEVQVEISAKDYQMVWVLILSICLGSIALASYPILRMKPKNILSQLS